jgi:hypothetical protein
MRPHGTRAKYTIERCHCADCRRANRDYQARREMRRLQESYGAKEPDLIDAGETRLHLLNLRRHGIGRRQVRRLTGLSTTTVMKIAKGQTSRVLASTADVILGITTDQRARGRWPA